MTVAALAAALVSCIPGVINPRFTPADLVRTSARILLLKASAPKDGAIAAEVVETLRGAPLPQKALRLELAEDAEVAEDDLAAAFGGREAAVALLVLSPANEKAGDAPDGAIQIDTQWFAVTHQQGKWRLDKDTQDLFAVWAGSARQLAEATRYVLADPAASFPVRSDAAWGGDAPLGKVAGKANGCLALDLGEPIGPCVLVLSDVGDRLYQAASKGGTPADITEKAQLGTKSKRIAVGDFDGDGHLDLASWDGAAVRLARQTAPGTFGVASPVAEVPDCLSLDALGGGVVAGTPRGPVLLPSLNGAAYAARKVALAAAPKAHRALGPGGMCLATDLDGDGRCDILQLHAKGIAFYAGEGHGTFKPPVEFPVPLPKAPCAALAGDYDADGRLDLVVCGEDGLALIARAPDERWENATHTTGELAYHGNANQPRILAATPCDINGDGRQGIALFYPDRPPMLFFNRGFACFGLARELELSGTGGAAGAPMEPLAPEPQAAKLKAAEALQRGQAAGTVLDLNGDGIPDLLAVTPQGDVWALFGKREGHEPLDLTVALPPRAAGPLTLAVSRDKRPIAIHVLRPGRPATIGVREPGPILLEWSEADGKHHKREVIVERRAHLQL